MHLPHSDFTQMTTSESRPGYRGSSDSQWTTESEQDIPTAIFVTLVYTSPPAQSAREPTLVTKHAPRGGGSSYGGVYPSMVRVAFMKVWTRVSPTYISAGKETMVSPPPELSFGFTTHSDGQRYG